MRISLIFEIMLNDVRGMKGGVYIITSLQLRKSVGKLLAFVFWYNPVDFDTANVSFVFPDLFQMQELPDLSMLHSALSKPDPVKRAREDQAEDFCLESRRP